VLALAYSSRPHQKTGVAPINLVTPRPLRNVSLERMPDGMKPDPSQRVTGVQGCLSGVAHGPAPPSAGLDL